LRKINDWFFAGAVAGFISGIGHLLWNSMFLLLGVQYKTFWIAMAGLFYNQKLLFTPLAQVHGAIDAIGVSVVGGILLSAILKFTGINYLYVKSVILSASSGYFLFIVVFPQTSLGKDSTIVPWIALFGFMIFNGLLNGYLLKKIYFRQPFI
jgi:hypothetical protein